MSPEAPTTSYPPDQVRFLQIDGREFILVGTAHVSKGSTDLVREVIEREKPDHVAVELDQQRYQALTEQQRWESLAQDVDPARAQHVRTLLGIQAREAQWWRDACLLYFQTFSGLPIPTQYEQPANTLAYYQQLRHYYVPGIRERRFG